MSQSILTWVLFNTFIALILLFDILWSKGKSFSLKDSIIWTIVWTILALIVNVWIFISQSSNSGLEFLTAYIAERALSFDNLFVFILIFQFFNVPNSLQPLTLTYGIIGALICRAIFIAVGISVIGLFSWVIIILGIVLIYSGIKILITDNEQIDPKKNLLYKTTKIFFRFSEEFKGNKFFYKNPKGNIILTPLVLVILILASTDLVFAIDSIPTVLGITSDSFIIWSSNMMAVVGMRPLYFLLLGMKDYFRFLKHGLSLILVLIGLKMIFGHGIEIDDFSFSYHVGTGLSLVLIVLTLLISISLSIIFPKRDDSKI